MKKLICVIPASKNDYSSNGDLIKWGGTTF